MESAKHLWDIWKKYRALILSLLLSVFSLPMELYSLPGGQADGSWVRAINMAIRDHFVFGKDVVFTYGPLGFLSSRNSQYISVIFLLLGDLLVTIGFFHVIHQFLKQYRGWFFVVLTALFLFRCANYSQTLFLIFIVFVLFNFRNQFKSYFELSYCAIAGVLLFFIKINYGLISISLMLAITLYLAFKNRKAFLVFLSVSLVVFLTVYLNVHVDLINYIKYSLPLIQYYDEAMFLPINTHSREFILAAAFMSIFGLTIAIYFFRLVKQRSMDLEMLLTLSLLCLCCFLLFKNGFTRFDLFHYNDFFFVFPFFTFLVLFLAGFGRLLISKFVIVCMVILSFANNSYYVYDGSAIANFLGLETYNSIINYIKSLGYEQRETFAMPMPVKQLKEIGNATIDIMPKLISILQVNHLNYQPRPVIQSYSAYSGSLDSLNAMHFYGSHRPEMLMMKNDAIDGRYCAWDESLTKAVVHLNYDYIDRVPFDGDSINLNNPETYLLLHAKTSTHELPVFEKISEVETRFGDTLKLYFQDTAVIYMTATVEYNTIGKIRKILYQPALINVTFVTDSQLSTTYRVVRPTIGFPVLVNKSIANNTELKNFIDGNIRYNHNIKSMVFQTESKGLHQKIKIAFFRFNNY